MSANREATQVHIIFDGLIKHCGKRLDAELIEQIEKELLEEIQNGPCSWAFAEDDKNKKLPEIAWRTWVDPITGETLYTRIDNKPR